VKKNRTYSTTVWELHHSASACREFPTGLWNVCTNKKLCSSPNYSSWQLPAGCQIDECVIQFLFSKTRLKLSQKNYSLYPDVHIPVYRTKKINRLNQWFSNESHLAH